jgi:hypothetical protein
VPPLHPRAATAACVCRRCALPPPCASTPQPRVQKRLCINSTPPVQQYSRAIHLARAALTLSACRVLDVLPEPLLALFSHHVRVPHTPAPRSSHRQSRWVARRERERRLLSRSPSASGPAQSERLRGPRWWPRQPRSRHQAVLDHSVSGSSQPGAGAEAEAGAESEVPGPPEP